MDWAKWKGALILLGVVIVFLIVILIMGGGNFIVGDGQLFMALNPSFNPSNPLFAFFVHFSTWGPGDFGLGIWGFILFALVLLLLSLKFPALRPMRFILILVIVGFIIGYLGITTVTKHIIWRPRPYTMLTSNVNDWFPFFYPSGSIGEMFDFGLQSFPSGHATTVFIFATPFIILYKNYLIKIVAIIYAVTGAYARVFLGVHYPSDILVGSLIGILTVVLCYVLLKKYLLPRAPWFQYEELEE